MKRIDLNKNFFSTMYDNHRWKHDIVMHSRNNEDLYFFFRDGKIDKLKFKIKKEIENGSLL